MPSLYHGVKEEECLPEISRIGLIKGCFTDDPTVAASIAGAGMSVLRWDISEEHEASLKREPYGYQHTSCFRYEIKSPIPFGELAIVDKNQVKQWQSEFEDSNNGNRELASDRKKKRAAEREKFNKRFEEFFEKTQK